MRGTFPWIVLSLVSSQLPSRQTSQSKSASDEFITISDDVIVLDSTSTGAAIQTLDYGHSIDGIPAFEVLSAEGDTSVFEITYGESSAALKTYMVIDPH